MTQRLLNINVNISMENAFGNQLIEMIKNNPSYNYFLDYVTQYNVLEVDTDHKLMSELTQSYLEESNKKVQQSNPYLIYTLSKSIRDLSQEDKIKAKDTLRYFIINETDPETRRNLIFWLLDVEIKWTNNNINQDTVDLAMKYLNLSDVNEYAENNRELYYFLVLQKKMSKHTEYLDIFDNIALNIENTLNPEDIYFKLKILSLNTNIQANYKQFYEDFYDSVDQQKDNLYPRYVIENSNVVDMIMSEILTKHVFKNNAFEILNKDGIINWENSSRTELYYGLLYLQLNKMIIPENAKKKLDRYMKEDENESITSNYYIYKSLQLLGHSMSTEKLSELKLEMEEYIKSKDPWYAIHALDLWLTFTNDYQDAEKLLKNILSWIDTKESVFDSETFFILQLIKFKLNIDLIQVDIDDYYQFTTIKNLSMVTGKRGEMDIHAIYQYTVLDILVMIQNKDNMTDEEIILINTLTSS
ncbi:hypothetical protein ACQKFM_29775 [Paenibacillus xylanexedens]